jgi:hypothetical protein
LWGKASAGSSPTYRRSGSTEGLGCSVRLEFSVPGRIDRAAFLDMGDGQFAALG